MHFEKIKLFLERMRNAEYKVLQECDDMFQFEIRTKYTEKLFTVHFRDGSRGDNLDDERPRWHYYYLQFEQENVPSGDDGFCDIVEWKWYIDEDAVTFRIKTLKNRYKY